MKKSITDEFIERLRGEADIVSVISEYVPLKRRGKNFWGCCPFHHEKTPSFSVSPDKGLFYCFGCHTGGNVFTFLTKLQNIPFVEALELLAKKLNLSLPEQEQSEAERLRQKNIQSLFQVNMLAKNFFYGSLKNSRQANRAREYLYDRGLADDVIDAFQLGYSLPGWDDLLQYMAGQGIEHNLLLQSGLCVQSVNQDKEYDRFRNRIMFPILDGRGNVIGFGGRIMDDGQPKYLNSPETLIFNKRNVLYGIDKAGKHIRDIGTAIVVEGYMDAITAHTYGFCNVVASLGTAFTPEQGKMLLRHGHEIIFAYDADAAGQNATLRALTIIRDSGALVKVLQLPDEKDPDDFIRKYGKEAFAILIEKAIPLLDYQIAHVVKKHNHLTPEGKGAIIHELTSVLNSEKSAVALEAQIRKLAQVLEVDERSIFHEIRKNSPGNKNLQVTGKPVVSAQPRLQADSAVIHAEKFLLRLMADDFSLIPYVISHISQEEFIIDTHRNIFEALQSISQKKNCIEADLFIMELNEEARTTFSQIMTMEFDRDDILRLVDDSIKTVCLYHLNRRFKEHTLRAAELEKKGDIPSYIKELEESKKIHDQINRYKLLSH